LQIIGHFDGGMIGSKKWQQSGFARYRLIGLLGGPVLAAAILVSPAPVGLSQQGWWTSAVGILMAAWWMTEALPLAATAMLPLILFPLLNVRSIEASAAPYAHPLVFLFFGGFLIARAMHVWGLDRRLALTVLRIVGSRPRNVIVGIMGVTAFLSMWVSNTATAMMMLPIGLSIVTAYSEHERGRAEGVAPALLLGIAYAATIGGMGTIIGTPPNALFVAFMAESYGIEISFLRWMLIGVPLVLVLLPITWFVLTQISFPIAGGSVLEKSGAISEKLAEIGPISNAERMVSAVMLLVAVCWIFRPLITTVLPSMHLSDAGIAMTGALLLFLLPVDVKRGRFLLSWKEAAEIRWDVLILFGGGLALAAAIGSSDLADWIGAQLTAVGALPVLLLLLVVGVLIVFLGELASNTAMAAVFLPIAGATATGMGEPALLLTLPVALFATLGFMLPVATPPNAVIFGSGAVQIKDMLRAGVILDLVGIVIVSLAVMTLGLWVLGYA
jgi:sodium-dependent dicarboxylate transporter 2/3/5